MEKWFFIAIGAILISLATGEAYQAGKKTDAKRDVLVACYKSGATNCEQQVTQEFN